MNTRTIRPGLNTAAPWMPAAVRLRALWVRLAALLLVWRLRARGRAQLRKFSARDLRDLGLGRGEVLFEADKPFWRA